MIVEWWFYALGIGVLLSPTLLLAVIGIRLLLDWPLSERATALLTEIALFTGLISAVGILVLMILTGSRYVPIELGNWVAIPEQHFHFHLKFVFDRLSVPFTILTLALCGTISKFANSYLHRDPGYHRFFVLFAVFQLGMIGSALAGTVETLFFGWELVGLSSALLVAYFHERTSPVQNGLRIWIVYRIADAAFLIAALSLHHLNGGGEFEGLMGAGPWPDGRASIAPEHAIFVGLLLIVAAAGKSALIPFSGWLPRAMEGPTPSSAIFYGALSVHLGPYLLLRFSPLFQTSLFLQIVIVTLGLSSAILGALAARVQTDVKSALAFASLTQVGIIVVEIGLGFQYLALIHIIGHACLRTLQLLRAPSLLRDYRAMENAIGSPLSPLRPERQPTQFRVFLYRFSLERGFLDSLLQTVVVEPFWWIFSGCDRLERRWTDFLSAGESLESDQVQTHVETLEEFL